MINKPAKPIDPGRGIIVGVTGGIASGKSTASRLLAEKGAFTINLDEIGHELLKRGSPVMDELLEAFGPDILDVSGDVSRKKLGAIVFADNAKRERLNAIMHPPIVQRSQFEARQLVAEDPNCVVVIDVPLLIEGERQELVDVIVVVTTSPENQLQRLLARSVEDSRPLNHEEAQARISVQIPLFEKEKFAHFVIDNNGTLDELSHQVDKLWGELRRLKTL
jgi:dephospho-CoA kinase